MTNFNKKFLLINGSAEKVLKDIPDNTFHTVVTSPPYWQQRDYFVDGQRGREETIEEYINNLVNICREVKRTLRKDGTFWLNIGDSYNNNSGFCRSSDEWKRGGRENGSSDKKFIIHPYIKRKELFGIPWTLAIALQKDGWYLRCDIIYSKTNPMPDGAKDRPTRSHEYIFLLTKSQKYFYDYYATLENTLEQPENIQTFGAKHQEGTFRQDQNRTFEHYGKRNKRSVWTTSVASYKGGHYATFNQKLIDPCIVAGTSEKGCCIKCSSPWKRILEKVKVLANNKKGYEVKLLSKGWKPTCKCNIEETKPCLVLDPFSGMATTGLAAIDHFQNYVGIELNEKYLKESRKRLYGTELFIEEVKSIGEF